MGTINGSGPYLRCRIEYSITTGTGGATVSATLYAQNQDNAYFQAHLYEGYSLTIDGSTKSGSGGALSGSSNGSVALLSHSKWIAYTGTRGNITISSHFGPLGVTINGTYIGERNASGSVAMPKVGSAPSKSTLTAPTNATVAENTKSIVVKWNSGSSYNGKGMYRVDVSINGGAWKFVSGDLAWGTTQWTYNISNGAQGNTYKFRIDTGNDVGWSGHTESGTITLNKLNPPSIGALNTYNPYTTATLTVPLSGGSQTSGEGFKRYCTLHDGSTWLKDCDNYGSAANNNTSCPITWAAANYMNRIGAKAYQKTFTIHAWTQNSRGARSSVVTKNFTVNINTDGGATPTLGAFTLSGGLTSLNGTAVAYGAHVFLAGIHNITVSSPAAGQHRNPSGTTLSYQISCTGKSNINAQSGTFTGMTSGQKTITVKVTDSRGLSASQSKTIMVQSYTAPQIKSFSVQRLENPQTSAQVTYALTYSPVYMYTDGSTAGNQINSIAVQQQRKNASTSWANITSGSNVTGLDTDTSYDLEFRCADAVRNSTFTTTKALIPTIKIGLAIRKWGVGIQCAPQSSNAFEVNGRTHIKGQMFIDKGLELCSGGSYIDFHYGDNNSTDYTHRIIADSSTHLTFSTPIKYRGSATSWVNGRDNAFIRTADTPATTEYVPILSSKSNTGSWDLGVYEDDKMNLSFVSDVNYNAGNNALTTRFKFEKNGSFTSQGRLYARGGFHVPDVAEANYFHAYSTEGISLSSMMHDLFSKSSSAINSGIGAIPYKTKFNSSGSPTGSNSAWVKGNFYPQNGPGSAYAGMGVLTGWLEDPLRLYAGQVVNNSLNNSNSSSFSISWKQIPVPDNDNNLVIANKIFATGGLRLTKESEHILWSPTLDYITKAYGNNKHYIHFQGYGNNGAWGVDCWNSDERLKHNIAPSKVDGLELLKKIKTYEFDWNESNDHVDLGFVSQQLKEVDDSLVFSSSEDEDALLQPSQSGLIPLVTKALQELTEKVETLENTVEQLSENK